MTIPARVSFRAFSRPANRLAGPCAVSLLMGIAACATPARAQIGEYEAVILGATDKTQAYGISADGKRQVGTNSSPTGDRAVIWNGSMDSYTDLNPAGQFDSRAMGISADGGTQVGIAGTKAYLWRGTAASAVNLNPFFYFSSQAYGVSGDGQTQVGVGIPNSGRGGATLWRGTADSLVSLAPDGYGTSYALAANGDGSLQGGYGATLGGGDDHALLWRGTADSVTDINPAGYQRSQVRAISRDGSLLAGVIGRTTGEHPALWSGSALIATDLLPAGYISGILTGISPKGRYQAGYARNSPFDLGHAGIWQGSADSFIDLQSLLPAIFDSSFATGVSDNGDVTGIATSVTTNGPRDVAVLWRHVSVSDTAPEPSALLLFGITVPFVTLRKSVWRRKWGLTLAPLRRYGMLYRATG